MEVAVVLRCPERQPVSTSSGLTTSDLDCIPMHRVLALAPLSMATWKSPLVASRTGEIQMSAVSAGAHGTYADQGTPGPPTPRSTSTQRATSLETEAPTLNMSKGLYSLWTTSAGRSGSLFSLRIRQRFRRPNL